MLVVVHQHNAVRAGRNLFQLTVRSGGRHVHIKPQVARMQVAVKLMDKGQVPLGGMVRQALKVQRDAAISRKCGQEANDLPAQRIAPGVIVEQVANTGIPVLGLGVVVIQVRKDFRVFLGLLNHPLDLVQLVRVMHRGPVHHRILAVGLVGNAHQRPLGRIHMQPLGKQQVDLVNVLLQRRIAGRVVRGVVGRAQTLAAVEGDLRRLARGLAVRVSHALDAAQQRRAVRHGLVVVLGNRQQQLRQLLKTQHVEDKNRQKQRTDHGGNIQHAA